MSLITELIAALLREQNAPEEATRRPYTLPSFRETAPRSKGAPRPRRPQQGSTSADNLPSELSSLVLPSEHQYVPAAASEVSRRTSTKTRIDAKDLRMGVVWAELLGAPRSKKPWVPR